MRQIGQFFPSQAAIREPTGGMLRRIARWEGAAPQSRNDGFWATFHRKGPSFEEKEAIAL